MKIFTQMVVQWVESVKKHDKNKQQLHQHPIHELPITAGLSESQPINVDGFPYKRSRHRRLGSISEISTISSLEATHHAYTHTHTLHWLRLHTDHPSMVMVLIFRDRQNSATQKKQKNLNSINAIWKYRPFNHLCSHVGHRQPPMAWSM